MRTRNLAARAGRWSAQHRKTAILGWIAFVAVTIVLGGAVGTKQLQDNQGIGESAHATRVLDSAFPKRATEQVLISSHAASATDPAFRATVGDVTSRLHKLPVVSDLRQTAVSRDGHSVLVQFYIDGT